MLLYLADLNAEDFILKLPKFEPEYKQPLNPVKKTQETRVKYCCTF
jgi:hypothetical protein